MNNTFTPKALGLLALVVLSSQFVRAQCGPLIPISCGETVHTNNYSTPNAIDNYICLPNFDFFGNEVIFYLENETAGVDLVVDLFSHEADLDLFVYRAECPIDYFASCQGYSTNFGKGRENIVVENALAGTYYIVVDAKSSELSSSFSLTVSCEPLDCNSIFSLECNQNKVGTTVTGSANRVSRYCNAPAGAKGTGHTGPERIYSFDIEQAGEVNISLAIFDQNANLELFLLNSCDANDCIAMSTKPAGEMETITVDLSVGTYYLVVDGFDGDKSDFLINLTCCEPEFNDPTTEASCSIDYEYQGVEPSDLSYRFNPTNVVSMPPGVSWLINGTAGGTTEGNDLYYQFSGPGTYEVCYPYTTGGANAGAGSGDEKSQAGCDYAYCCETFCIEPQPENLAGLVGCDNCGCTENDPLLPPAYRCDNFQAYPVGAPLPVATLPQWFGNASPVIDTTSAGNNTLSFAPGGTTTQLGFLLETGRRVPLERGRYRISFDMFVAGSASVGLGSGHATSAAPDIFQLIFSGGKATDPTLELFSFDYPEQAWFEFSQVIDVGPNQTRIEFFVDRQYVGTWRSNLGEIGQLNFIATATSDYRIDNLCVRTVPLAPIVCDLTDPRAVCLPSGGSYPDICAAGQQGLYAAGEYDNCFNACDYGGTLLSRNDQSVPVSGTLGATELAPNAMYSDPCVIDIYDGEVPEVLYADIFVFENNGEDFFRDLELADESLNVLVYQCECIDGVCETVCVPLVDGEYDVDPFGAYHIVVFGDQQSASYQFRITPSLENCSVETEDVYDLGDPLVLGEDFLPASDSITLTDNFAGQVSTFSAADDFGVGGCYAGTRDYDLPDRLYRFNVNYPAYLSFELTTDGGTAGLFLFSNACTSDCVGKEESRLFQTFTAWDSVRVGEGTYYLIVDQDQPVGEYTLKVKAEPDGENYNSGVALFTTALDISCPVDEPAQHQFTLRFPPNAFNTAEPVSVIGEYIYFDTLAMTTERGAASTLVPYAYTPSGQTEYHVFDLPKQAIPEDERCAFLAGDSIVFSARSGGYVQELIPTGFTFSALNPDTASYFVPAGKTLSGFRIEEIFSFDLYVDQLFLNADGKALSGDTAAFRVRSSAPFRIEIAPGSEWLRLPQTEFPGQARVVVKVAADPLEGTEPRQGKLRILTLTEAPIVQEISVFQYAPCTATDLAVTVDQADLCLGDSTAFSVTVNGLTGDAVLQQYDIYVDGELANDDLWLRPAADTDYTIYAVNKACPEEDSQTVSVRVYDRPTFAAGPTVCSADLTAYTADFSSDALPQTITLSAGVLTDLGGGNYRVTGVPTDEVLAIGLSSGECTIQERIFPPVCECPATIPVPQSSTATAYYCAGATPPTLTVSTESGYAINWSDAADNLLQSGPENSFTPPGPGTYFVAYQDENFTVCTSATPLALEVVELATIDVSAGPAPVLCLGDPLTLSTEVTAASADLPLVYAWAGGSTGPAFSTTPVDTGGQSIDLLVSYTGGQCPQTFTFDYYVIPEPAFQQVNQEPCGSDPGLYRQEFTTDADVVQVSAGDLSAQGATYVVENIPITEQLTVTYYNERQGVSCAPAEFTFPLPECGCPSNDLNYSYASENFRYCPGEELPALSFPDPGEGFTLVFYEAEDPEPLASQGVTFTPPEPGSYLFQIEATDRNCLGSTVYPFTVSYYDYPVAEAGMDLSVCVGETITLDATGSTSAGTVAWQWSGSPNLTNSESPQAQFTATAPGTTHITLTLTGDNQCQATDVVSITAEDRPSIVTEPIDVNDCSSELTTYAVELVSSVFIDDDDISAGTLFFENGSYRIEGIPAGTPVEITLTNGGCTVIETIASPTCACPAAAPQPQVAVTERFYCAGDPVPTLTVAELDGYRANWYDAVTGNQLLSDATSFTPDGPGRYAVAYEDQNFTVCRSEPTEIRVTELAEIGWVPLPEIVLCAGEPLTVSPVLTGATTGIDLEFTWAGQPGESSFSTVPAEAGPQALPWSVAYAGGRCAQSGTIDYYVIPEPVISPINQEPCGEDTTVYRAAFYSDADSVQIVTESGTVSRVGDEYYVEGIAIGTSVQVLASNRYQGIRCDPVSYTFDSPANCLCASNTLSYAYTPQTYAYCPGEELPVLTFPDPGEGFELAFFTAAGDPVTGVDAISMLPPVPGAYYFQIREQAQSCLSFLSYPFTVAVRPAPVAVAGADRFTCEGYTIAFDGTNSEYEGPGEWLWSAAIPLQNVTTPVPQAEPTTSGTYPIILRLTDTYGCVDRDTLLLAVAETPTVNYLLLDTIACFGESTGRVFIEPGGGSGPYTYAWANGSTERLRGGLAAGDYSLTVTDGVGCAAEAIISIAEPPELLVTAMDTFPRCNAEATGAIDLVVSGGTPGYSYAWSTGATTQDLTAVPAGNYVSSVTDSNGCTTTTEYALTDPPALVVASIDTAAATDGLANGSIAITVTGGTPPYEYTWFAGATELAIAGALATGLAAGDDYSVEVEDANGCVLPVGPLTVRMATATRTLPATALGLRVFPNPTRESVTIEVSRAGELEFWLTHPDGQVLRRQQTRTDTRGRTPVDLSALPAGLYFLRVRTGANHAVVPIIKW
jgi:hypothetical protein